MAGKPVAIEATTRPAEIPFDVAAFRFAKATEILMRADQRIREAALADLEVQEERSPKPKAEAL